jgi:hypothetical protein
MSKFTKALAIVAIAGTVAVPLAIAAEGRIQQQPHMNAALDHLQAAKKELQAATPDKAGHRVAAIKAVDDAIKHVNEGIAAGSKP